MLHFDVLQLIAWFHSNAYKFLSKQIPCNKEVVSLLSRAPHQSMLQSLLISLTEIHAFTFTFTKYITYNCRF